MGLFPSALHHAQVLSSPLSTEIALPCLPLHLTSLSLPPARGLRLLYAFLLCSFVKTHKTGLHMMLFTSAAAATYSLCISGERQENRSGVFSHHLRLTGPIFFLEVIICVWTWVTVNLSGAGKGGAICSMASRGNTGKAFLPLKPRYIELR